MPTDLSVRNRSKAEIDRQNAADLLACLLLVPLALCLCFILLSLECPGIPVAFGQIAAG
jgi:hypothetical protein